MANQGTKRFVRLSGPPRHSYTTLLVTVLALTVLGPIGRQLGYGEAVWTLLITSVLVAGLYSVSRRHDLFGVVVLLGLSALMANWLFVTDWDRAHRLGAGITGTLFFGIIIVLLLQDILGRKGRVSWQLINGALAVYLLMGMLFAFLFSLVETLVPGSFAGFDKMDGGIMDNALYLSFVSLTTLGYGDVTPARPVAAAFCYVEAIIGQIYLTVLVARLVGMQISAETAETAEQRG